MPVNKIEYALSGLYRRRRPRSCPSCGSFECAVIDRKIFHQLLLCEKCSLLYRFPYETAEEMKSFYRKAYSQPGLTTELPNDQLLDELLRSGFRGSGKDFSGLIGILDHLHIRRGARLLDFGANWGYGVWQFRQAGYIAEGYEPAVTRAGFGVKLGVNIATDWTDIQSQPPFDVVFSSHVLEHVPDPAHSLRQMVDVLAPGGVLVALTPNGSLPFRDADFAAFHKLWGQVHPVMLSDQFARKALGAPIFLGSRSASDLKLLSGWGQDISITGSLSGGELLLVWPRPAQQEAK